MSSSIQILSMKRYFFLIITFIGTIFCLFAQEAEKKSKFSPEITVSINQTTVGFKHDKPGFGIGAYNVFFNKKRCNLLVGLEFNWNGQFRKYKSPGYELNYVDTKNYISIPAYFRVNIGKKVKFFIEPGIFFDPFVFGRVKSSEKVEAGKTEVVINKVKLYMPDFGISGGVGLRIPIKQYEILLKCDYRYGLRKIFDFSTSNKHFNQTPVISLYNQYFRFTVGFKRP